MSYLNLHKATSGEREALALIRADAWAKNLSREEFCERNRILYAHPFGKNRIETLVLKNLEQKIVSSMDVLNLNFFFRESDSQKIQVKEGFLIASVMTPIQHRRKGFATYLLKEFLKAQKFGIGILYSDIGTRFYERYDFQKTKIQTRELIEPFGETALKPNPLSEQDWIAEFADFRRRRFESTQGAQVAVLPELEFWDWQIERYRYFARLRTGSELPTPFFQVHTAKGPNYFCVVKNCLTQTGDVLWFDSTCPESLAAIGKVVKAWGLRRISFWSPHDQGTVINEECPMVWFQGATKPVPEVFYDPQLCDWW